MQYNKKHFEKGNVMDKDLNEQLNIVLDVLDVLIYSNQKDKDITEIFERILNLVNSLHNVEKSFYIRDIKPAQFIPSKNLIYSKSIEKYANEILEAWIKLQSNNPKLEYITFKELIYKSQILQNVKFDNIDVEKTLVVRATANIDNTNIFIIEKKDKNELSEYEKDYIKKISLCDKFIYEKILKGETHLRNEKILTQVLDNIDALIYVSDVETGELLFVNDAMKKGFGLEDVKGKICWQVFQQGFSDVCDFCPVHNLKSIEDDPLVWEEHNTVTRKYYQNTDRLINWLDGKVVHIQHSVDITNIKNTESQLKTARDEAERNAKAKSEFLSKMSHELRTPLNAIIGLINIIEKSKDIDKINDFIKKMKSASNNLLQTINDILDISKIDAGKIELIEEPFNIEDMFRDLFDIIEYIAHDKDITIQMDIQTNKNNFIGDSKRLGQVYMNLLSNALKFTENGGKISISVKYNNLGNGLVEVISSVKDSGVGIPENKIGTLFQSFTQVDNSLSRQYNGTGLGLVIAKNIVELMGGQIQVESKVGKGSTFSFNTILKEGKSQDEIEISTDAFNILIIDDSEEICQYLSDLFEVKKIKHKIARSGAEGIDLIKKETNGFNVILVDYMMNGLDTVKNIRSIIDTDTIIIMISSIEWSIIEDEAKQLGINHFLPKPLLPSNVVNAINDVFKKKEIKHKETEEEIFDFSSKTILLFEDVDINREIVHLLLEDTSIKCIDAEDGEVGVKLYKDNPEKYDLILMDIQMPKIDGFEATKLIRESKMSNAKTIPIIAMTANVFAEQVQDTLSAGMNSHLGKPVNEIELKKELQKWFDKIPSKS